MFSLFVNTKDMRLRRVRQRVRALVDLAGDMKEIGDAPGRWVMVTLTYAEVDAWRADHVSKLTHCIKAWCTRRGCRFVYCWVAELQQRGAVHYHLLVKLPHELMLPKPDKRGWWKWGSTKVETVRKSGKRYLSKYTSKGNDGRGEFPRGCRICGAGGLSAAARKWWTWLLSPQYCRHETDPADVVRRVKGGWRTFAGRFIPTPWTATPVPDLGGVILCRKSVERWCDSERECGPVTVHLARESATRAVASFCDTMWQYGGLHFTNPWRTVTLAR